jgi:hypothetical protein
MSFTYKGYVAIYSYGDPETGVGTTTGTVMYPSAQDVFGFEPEAIAYFEVEGIIAIPQNQCGAV